MPQQQQSHDNGVLEIVCTSSLKGPFCVFLYLPSAQAPLIKFSHTLSRMSLTFLCSLPDLPQNGLLGDVSNGFTDAGDGLDLDELIDLNDSVVNPELEDALLAGDDDDDDESGANVVDKLLAEVVPKAAAVIGVGDPNDKVDSSTTAPTPSSSVAAATSTSLDNTGDDLDKLISKINDLEDCIETTSSTKDEPISKSVPNEGTAANEKVTAVTTAEEESILEDKVKEDVQAENAQNRKLLRALKLIMIRKLVKRKMRLKKLVSLIMIILQRERKR
ncbi:unnamed protein product [Ceratitis capitata]|uniref:(Mediterranean fruit fly) hypothetical protein n=1 Tax=Ceratitis capitata TaxID=7213 RepID=A0A811VMA7_CERCA|nr:unnamed protein product [Ceratitis capitata]